MLLFFTHLLSHMLVTAASLTRVTHTGRAAGRAADVSALRRVGGEVPRARLAARASTRRGSDGGGARARLGGVRAREAGPVPLPAAAAAAATCPAAAAVAYECVFHYLWCSRRHWVFVVSAE